MRTDKRSKQALNSNARLSHISVFVPSQIIFETRANQRSARFSRFKYTDFSLQLSPIEDGVIRDFPIMLRGDGSPWDLGNLYLMRKFTEMAKLAPPVIETLRSMAVRNYLSRLIRDIRQKDPDFNAFRFHDLRATYGMNFVRDADASGAKDIRDELKHRMGHSSFNTTQNYLNYDESNEMVRKATAYHHERIYRIIEKFQQ